MDRGAKPALDALKELLEIKELKDEIAEAERVGGNFVQGMAIPFLKDQVAIREALAWKRAEEVSSGAIKQSSSKEEGDWL